MMSNNRYDDITIRAAALQHAFDTGEPYTPTPESTEPNPHDPLAGAFTATWLMDQEFPPVEYAVPGVLTEGLGIIVSPPKVGKSWWVLGTAIACSTGGLAMNAIQVEQRPVLYLALEDGQRRLQQRLIDLGVTEVNEDLTFLTEIPAGAFLTIGAFLERNADRKPLIILDTLGKSRDVFTGNDAYQKDYKELGDFKDLVDRFPGSSLLIVHHTNKGAHGDFVSSVSGTQGIAGAADSILTIERERGKDEAILNVTSRDAAEGSYAMTFDNGAWHLDGSDLAEAADAVHTRRATSGLGDRMTQVVEHVTANGPLTPSQVAKALDLDNKTAGDLLGRAARAGRILKQGRGIYTSSTPVESVESESHNSTLSLLSTPPSASRECNQHGTNYHVSTCDTCLQLAKETA